MVGLVIPELTGAAVRRRSVEVVVWSHPLVSFREAHGDILEPRRCHQSCFRYG